ncbi:hypothetical protein ACFLFF_30300 [Brevibacillus reuszeri]|uniref:hypothetical protein n=1 Tax=Brevibacillus reuszeri TaxID=54915 RepID=UPI00367025C1
MRNELSFVFNTDKAYFDEFIPSLQEKIENVIFSSPALLVYENDGFEISINEIGHVTMSKALSNVIRITDELDNAKQEYSKLQSIDIRFKTDPFMKILMPKSSPELKELQDVDFKYRISDIESGYTVVALEP